MDDPVHLVILILHVLGATVIVGTAFISLLIQLKFPTTMENVNILGYIWKIIGPVIGIQVLTGLYLAGSEWDKFGSNPLFWIKMFLVFVVGLTVGIVSKRKYELMLKSGSTAVDDLKWAWLGLLTFATVAAIGVILAEMTA